MFRSFDGSAPSAPPPQFKLAVASTLAVAAAQNPAQPTYPVEWSATSE